MKVVKTDYVSEKEILFNLDPFTARPIMVDDEGITAVDGKKIVKAGSILDVDGAIANDATARYVLLKDTDVTYGPATGAGVYKGTVNSGKIPTAPTAEAKGALKGIFFMSEEDTNY